jgi:hypothetical protein
MLAERIGVARNVNIEEPLQACEAIGKMIRLLIRSLQEKTRKS